MSVKTPSYTPNHISAKSVLHQLHWGPCGVRDRHSLRYILHGTELQLLITLRCVFDRDSWECRAVSVIVRMVYHSSASTPLPHRTIHVHIIWRGRLLGDILSMQLCQRLCQIICMNLLIRRILILHHPPMRRTRWWRNEEQLVALREVQMYVFRVCDLGLLAEVDAYTAIEDDFIVKGFTN